MQAKLKYIHDFDIWYKLVRFEVRPMKFVVSAGVVTVLVIAWVLTNPLFQLRDRLVSRGRAQNKTQIQHY